MVKRNSIDDIELRHILLLRHGQTDCNAGNVIQGHRPTPLNAVGREQARRLAAALRVRRPGVDALVSSDLPRAAQTAGPAGEACGLPVRLDAAWRERCFGPLEGKPAAEADIWRVAAGEIDPPGAESSVDFAQRIQRALEGLASHHPEARTIAVVTHGGPCRQVLRLLAEGRLPLVEGGAPAAVTIANCSIMHLVRHQRGQAVCWELAGLNQVDHLGDLCGPLRDAG